MLAAMAKLHTLEAADESFFTTAPHVYRFPVELAVPPERVWESLTSDGSLADWGLGIKLRWTTPRPFGIGTARSVTMPLGLVTVNERFFVWDEGRRYAFYVESSDKPLLNRFAEDYVVEKTPTGSRFTWTIAIEPKPRLRHLVALGGPLNKLAFGQTARAAKRYFAKHPVAA
jgi:hypothetical protein